MNRGFIRSLENEEVKMIDGSKDPFGYPFLTYLWVVSLACVGGAVRYLNTATKMSWLVLLRDVFTAGFAGLLTFWLCEWTDVQGPLAAVLIATSGLMGTRALKEIENLYRIRLGLQLNPGPATDTQSDDNRVSKTAGMANTGIKHEGE